MTKLKTSERVYWVTDDGAVWGGRATLHDDGWAMIQFDEKDGKSLPTPDTTRLYSPVLHTDIASVAADRVARCERDIRHLEGLLASARDRLESVRSAYAAFVPADSEALASP